MKDIFDNYKLNVKVLLDYGFIRKENSYVYDKVLDDDLSVKFTIKDKLLDVLVYENDSLEKFLPYYIKQSNGSYTTSIKEKIEEIKLDILDKCFYKNNLKKELLDYVKEKYGTTPEYPWEKSKEDCTLKTKSNKWYALFMNVSSKVLKLKKEGNVDILNIKNKPEIIEKLIDNKTYFPAYHMNKKHWITILLDNNTNIELIKMLIDDSYELTMKA